MEGRQVAEDDGRERTMPNMRWLLPMAGYRLPEDEIADIPSAQGKKAVINVGVAKIPFGAICTITFVHDGKIDTACLNPSSVWLIYAGLKSTLSSIRFV
jgi:hypothetical protein